MTDTTTLGPIMDRFLDGTVLYILFADEHGVYRTPPALYDDPHTVRDLKDNPYLRGLTVSRRRHWFDPQRAITSGWDIWVDGGFDRKAYEAGRRTR